MEDHCPSCCSSPCACAEAAPPPPTENARAGADEPHEYKANHGSACWCGEYAYVSVHNAEARRWWTAGRARGIEEERKRCEGIAREAIRWGGASKLALRKCNEIADAIAKETGK